METTPPSSRSSTALLAAAVLASVAIVGCAAVAIAYFLGFLGGNEQAASTPAAMPAPGQQVAGTAPEGSLLPGETLVTSPEPPKSAIPPPAPAKPAMPPAAAPTTPVYARTPTPAVKPKPAPQPAPHVAQAPPPPPPLAPQSQQQTQQAAPAPTAHTEATKARIVAPAPRDYCVNCGVVTSVTERGDYWDVLVRFEDGSTQTLRYPEEPRFKLNEHVHLEDGRLVKD